MASFDSDAFDTSAFSVSAWDFIVEQLVRKGKQISVLLSAAATYVVEVSQQLIAQYRR